MPPAALAIHLCIGQVYAFSVFKNPLVAKFDTSETAIAIVFSIAIVMLGLAAAFGGKWMERNGPRKAMFLSAVCFSAGLLIGSVGIAKNAAYVTSKLPASGTTIRSNAAAWRRSSPPSARVAVRRPVCAQPAMRPSTTSVQPSSERLPRGMNHLSFVIGVLSRSTGSRG